MPSIAIPISQLNSLTGSAITQDDFFPIVDSGSLSTKRLTIGELKNFTNSGSFYGTASYASNSLSASNAVSASYATNVGNAISASLTDDYVKSVPGLDWPAVGKGSGSPRYSVALFHTSSTDSTPQVYIDASPLKIIPVESENTLLVSSYDTVGNPQSIAMKFTDNDENGIVGKKIVFYENQTSGGLEIYDSGIQSNTLYSRTYGNSVSYLRGQYTSSSTGSFGYMDQPFDSGTSGSGTVYATSGRRFGIGNFQTASQIESLFHVKHLTKDSLLENLGWDSSLLKVSSGSAATPDLFVVKDNGNVGIGNSYPGYKLFISGSVGFTPGNSVTASSTIGTVVFELTNNTTFTVKARGSDGIVRSGSITLS